MGCDIVALVDPVASQIKADTFRQFVTPNAQPAIKAIREAGATSCFFICGDCTKVLEEVCKIGTDAFAVDEQLNLGFVRNMAQKYKLGFSGNLKLDAGFEPGFGFTARGCDSVPERRRSDRVHAGARLRHALRRSGGTRGPGL